MRNKSNTFENLKKFITEAMNQFKTTIKIIRSNTRAEFTSHDFQNLLRKHGISQQLTCPYIPQQNSIAKRKHRHLLDISRSIMFY